MRADAKEPKRSWAPAFVGAAGTVSAMLFAFLRIGIDPEWETLFKAVAIGLTVLVVVTWLVVLTLALRSRQ